MVSGASSGNIYHHLVTVPKEIKVKGKASFHNPIFLFSSFIFKTVVATCRQFFYIACSASAAEDR